MTSYIKAAKQIIQPSGGNSSQNSLIQMVWTVYGKGQS